MARLIKIDKINEGEVFCKWVNRRFIQNKNILTAETGATGCQPKGSKVLMANGEWKNIEMINKGDLILSPQKDGSHSYSKVISTTKWFCNKNYDIIEKNKNKQKLYSCSYNHIIPTYKKFRERRTKNGKRYVKRSWWDFFNYEADIFSKMSNKMKSHQNIGFSSFMINKFNERKNCKIEPYTLGVFLGDGMFQSKTSLKLNKHYKNQKRSDKKKFHKRTHRAIVITSMDLKIIEEVSKYYPVMNIYKKQGTNALGYSFSVNSKFSKLLSKYNLEGKNSGNKFIPKEALLSDSEYRKRLLAGLIDTDGYYRKKGGGYTFTLKSKELIKGIKDLVYSLGGRCGKIRKVKKQIKSIDFEGTYYIINFYLGDLKLPLKCNRKKRDVSTIYLNSNRIGIDLIKNNKRNMVYGFELDSKSKWFITNNWMVTHNSGKSYRDLRKAELWYDYKFKRPYNPENICFGVDKVFERLNSGELQKGEILVCEEAGVNLGSLDFQNRVSKMFTYVLQSFRSMNIGIFFNLPYLSMLNKQARMLIHYSGESVSIDFQNETNKCKPFFHQVNQNTGKIYRKYPRVKYNGRVTKIKRFTFGLPSEELRQSYEIKKVQYLSTITKEFEDELTEINKKKIRGSERKEMSEKQLEVYNLACQGLTQKEMAKKLEKTIPAICVMLKTIKKHGYLIEKQENIKKI